MRIITPLITILALLCSCNPQERMNDRSVAGAWAQVETPSGAPQGTTCWVWGTDGGDHSIGGPECFQTTPPPAQDCTSCHPTN